MSKTKITQNEYKKLRNELEKIISSGRARAGKAVTEIAVKTHWEVGKRLNDWIGDRDTGSVAGTMENLAGDLGLHSSALYRSHKFFRTYPRGLPSTPEFRSISWGAHTELLPLADEEERLFYMKRASEEAWSRKSLRNSIRADEYGKKTASAHGTGSVRLKRPEPGLYTYVAELERVVDGDTIIVRIDLGFDVLRRQRIRLRYIDTPPVDTPEGEKAKRFVEKTLKNIARLALRTYQLDMYGRYVADIVYDTEAVSKDDLLKNGRFLNQEIIDRGLAVFMA